MFVLHLVPLYFNNSADSSFESESLDASMDSGLAQSMDSVKPRDSRADSRGDSRIDSRGGGGGDTLVDLGPRSISFQPLQPARYDKDDDDKEGKKKPSFFKSFKEKLSKGMFMFTKVL